MALIACPECQNKISDKASSCPHCGNPMQAIQVSTASGKVVTTEQTGKEYKAQQLIGAVLICIGLVLIIAEQEIIGAIMGLGGLALYLVARFNAWWKHG